MMVVNCSEERSFCKVKRIKSELRGSAHRERVSGLSLTSVEHMLKNTDFGDVVNDFAQIKSRRVPLQTA